jgi:hypothetical protein
MVHGCASERQDGRSRFSGAVYQDWQMRVLSSQKVVESAEKIGRKILDTYLEPNKTIPELREMVASNSIDILRDFEEACREEFDSLRSQQF